MPGSLFLIAAPLGNPEDLSPRAARLLREVSALYAEDTRTAKRWLAERGVSREVRSCFDANEEARGQEIAAQLGAGQDVGFISEAGTPAVSDPGYRLVRAAIACGARVVPVPGPSAALAALVASGLPTDRFLFAGFPPRKEGARRRWLQQLAAFDATLILFESPLRVAATVADALATLGDRPACVAREISKTHEEFVRAPLSGLLTRYRDERPLGEVTLVVGGAAADPAAQAAATDEAITARARERLAGGQSVRDVVASLTGETGRPHGEIYRLVLAARDGG